MQESGQDALSDVLSVKSVLPNGKREGEKEEQDEARIVYSARVIGQAPEEVSDAHDFGSRRHGRRRYNRHLHFGKQQNMGIMVRPRKFKKVRAMLCPVERLRDRHVLEKVLNGREEEKYQALCSIPFLTRQPGNALINRRELPIERDAFLTRMRHPPVSFCWSASSRLVM
jgi:hypothetical protein